RCDRGRLQPSLFNNCFHPSTFNSMPGFASKTPVSSPQLCPNLCNEIVDIIHYLECKRWLWRAGLFQIVKLTVENRWVGKMPTPFLQLRGNSRPTPPPK